MKNEVFYEFCFQHWDGEDIHDNDFWDDYSDALRAVEYHRDIAKDTNLKVAIELYRNFGNDEGGLLERGFAIAGDTHFCSGQKVPKAKRIQLMELHRRLHK